MKTMNLSRIDAAGKGGLTIFWELLTVILCAKTITSLLHRYLQRFGNQIETEGSLKIEEAILWFLAQKIKRQQR